jgi:pimeloyl-ACP methyl ester carboxylesterase
MMTKPKILLIHGWNHVNYTSSGCIDTWSDRSKFVQALSQHFNVVTINLPGFCGQPDPRRPWTLDDYVDYVDVIIEKEVHLDYILGYSFGGAIVLHWKKRGGDVRLKTFLVSPAIIRKYKKRDLSFVQKTLKSALPKGLVSLLRDIYLTKVVKNPYYSKATKVMRETYRNIVAVNLREDLLELSDPITLIYGENDTATPPDLIREVLEHSQAKHRLRIIPLGGHDIANSHTEALVSLIVGKIGNPLRDIL